MQKREANLSLIAALLVSLHSDDFASLIEAASLAGSVRERVLSALGALG
jgi:hypothetical protein